MIWYVLALMIWHRFSHKSGLASDGIESSGFIYFVFLYLFIIFLNVFIICSCRVLDQWCMLLGIKWYQFVRNNDVRRLTKQPKLTSIIQSHQLTMFGHIMCMDHTQLPR